MTTPPLDLLDLVDLLADFPDNEFLDVPRGHLTALLARATAAEAAIARVRELRVKWFRELENPEHLVYLETAINDLGDALDGTP